MKFNKKFVLAASLMLGMGMAVVSCDDDDSKDDNKKADKCLAGMTWNSEANQCEGTPTSCGNGKLDEGEVCDTVEEEGHSVVKFKDNYGTCNDWYNENKNTEEAGQWEGQPGCAKTCMALSKSTCTLPGGKCGNGVIDYDAGEICDIGEDPNNFEDDILADGVDCSVKGGTMSEYVANGKPACPKDCRGPEYGKGSCELLADHEVNGLDACEASISIADDTASGSLKLTMHQSTKKAAVTMQCTSTSTLLAAFVNNFKPESADFTVESGVAHTDTVDLSTITDVGDYMCFFFAKVEGENGVFCGVNNTIVELNDATANPDSIKLATFTRESSASADTLAKWLFTGVTKDAVVAGLAPEDGTQKDNDSIKLSWVSVNDEDQNFDITSTIDSQQVVGNALQIKITKQNKPHWSETHAADSGSHIAITDLSGLSITKMAMTAKYGKNDETVRKVWITADDGTSETVINSDGENMTEAYVNHEFATIPEGTKTIRIYGDSSYVGALAIDDLTLFGSVDER